jgi:hypothetical protein
MDGSITMKKPLKIILPWSVFVLALTVFTAAVLMVKPAGAG